MAHAVTTTEGTFRASVRARCMSPPDHGHDGRPSSELDEQAVYRAVRYAVEDAILAVLGTLLLLGVAFVLLVAGAQIATQGTPTTLAVGILLGLYALYIAAATLDVVPSVRECF